MTIVYHFANPDMITFIHLTAFIILTVAGYQLKKRNQVFEIPFLFFISGIIGMIWFIVSFLIPAYMFTTPPTDAELQFTNLYSFFWHNLVPSLILIVIFGITNIILGLKNRENYGIWILVSGIFYITFMFLDILLNSNLIFEIIIFIGMLMSSLFFLYFSIRFKNSYLIIFSVIFLFSLILPAIGLNLYIPIY